MATKVMKNKLTLNLEKRNVSDIKKAPANLSSDSRKKSTFSDKPTPLDFDKFIPWVCMEWQVPEVVTITRINQEKMQRWSSSAKNNYINRSVRPKEDDELTSKKESASTSIATKSSQVDNVIPISAYYDSHGHLAEIAIVMCPSALHRKIIQAINLCLPFHSFLTKLVIRKGCLNYLLLHEISKLLPHSNLTDVCLDDTYVPEGNYYVLLEQASNIKYLSLNRCSINDEVCKEIASRIDFGRPAEKSLMVLNLGSNSITDIGAKYFGQILRKNRHLLHLNFLGNRIGDIGLEFLVEHLLEFPLTYHEIIDKKRRKMEYYQRKHEVYERCLEELTRMQRLEEMCSIQSDRRSSINTRQAKSKKNKRHPVVELSLPDIADKMTLDILGDEHNDPFDDDNINIRDNNYYCTGNMKLCSLNIAYNNIEFPSLLRILKVLSYQCLLEKFSSCTGLVRLVLEGNNLCNSCPELERIDMYLKTARQISMHQAGHTKKRTSLPMGKHHSK